MKKNKNRVDTELTVLKHMKDIEVVSDETATFKCYVTAKKSKKNVEYQWLDLL